MNLVLLEDADLTADGHAVVRGERARHIHDVHRASVGDTLRVGLTGGLTGEGIVTAISPGEVVLAVRLSECPPAASPVELLLALPRPKMLRRLLGSVASMGVKRIILINSARVEKSYFDSPLLAPAALDEELRLGLAQARDTVLPRVRIVRRFRPFVEDEAAAVWPAPARRFVAHPDAATDLWSALPESTRDPMVLAVGPEGGWVPFEVELLEAHGFQRLGVGPRVLRVEVAVPFLLGQFALHAARGGRPR
jgi:RsmE family RNA methyltransferase